MEPGTNGGTHEKPIAIVFPPSISAHTARLGAFYTAAKLMPLEAFGGSLATDSRVAETPLVDRGFASVRQIGKGSTRRFLTGRRVCRRDRMEAFWLGAIERC